MIFTRKKEPSKPAGATAKPRPEPTQKELLEAALRPGREVSLALTADLVSDKIDVRASMVHDVVKNGLLILAQPDPPLPKRAQGQAIEVTFLVPHPDRGAEFLRLGYKTNILKLIDGWKVDREFTDNVIVVAKPQRLERTTLRLYYRVEPASEVPLELHLGHEGPELVVLDLSVGGARFNHKHSLMFESEQEIDLVLRSGEILLELRAQVVRTSRESERSLRAPVTTAVKFIEVLPETKNGLSRLINEIARRQRARDAGL